jgi:hypothetical protein
VNSTLKIEKPEPMTLIEKIKAQIKKRAEVKAKRMLLKRPRRLTNATTSHSALSYPPRGRSASRH